MATIHLTDPLSPWMVRPAFQPPVVFCGTGCDRTTPLADVNGHAQQRSTGEIGHTESIANQIATLSCFAGNEIQSLLGADTGLPGAFSINAIAALDHSLQ